MGYYQQSKKFAKVSAAILAYAKNSAELSRQSLDSWSLRKKRASLISQYSRQVLQILNIRVVVKDPHLFLLKDNALLVANHMSYLDVLLLASVYSCSFVTSQEMRQTPVLGWLCELGGSVYVERRNKKQLGRELAEITEALGRGLNVCVFPEATSHNAEQLLRFRAPLFNAARYAHKKILPVAINYCEIDDQVFSTDNRDMVCWYGDMDFLPHMWQLCGRREIVAELQFLDPITAKIPEPAQVLAKRSQEIVGQYFKPLASTDVGLDLLG